jgi:hypothetical protein
MDDGGEGLGGEIMRAVMGVLSRNEQRERVRRSRMGTRSALGLVRDAALLFEESASQETLLELYDRAIEQQTVAATNRASRRGGRRSPRGFLP